jgi:hypothetical protein
MTSSQYFKGFERFSAPGPRTGVPRIVLCLLLDPLGGLGIG